MFSKGTELIFTLLVLVAACHSSPRLFESEKEYIYNYHAKINVGTFKPAIFASQFMLDGKLHVQHASEHTLLLRLSDLKYKLYNGELDNHDEHEAIALPLPTEAEDLLKPIQLNYKDGKIVNFASDMDDHQFSTDMKKAIASMMQLDLLQLKFDVNIPYAFIATENSIYGNIEAKYNILPDETEIVVQKMLDIQSSQTWLSYFGITENDSYEDMKNRSTISIDSNREYILQRLENGFDLQSIDSQGGIFSHMMKGFTETQFMYVNQTLLLAKKIPLSEKMSLNQEKTTVEDLRFKIELDDTEETLPSLAFTRTPIKMEIYEKLIDGILDEVVAHTKTQKLKTETPKMQEGQGINRLHRFMAMLDLPALEKMFLHLRELPNQDKFNIFQEMIPLIGTRASIKFVRNLIRKQKVDDSTAVDMLQKMPIHLQMPSGKLLTEVEDLMNLENVSPNVHKVGVMSFATLVYKTYTHYMIENNLIKQSIKEDLLEKYILKYMEMLKASQDYSSQMLYMHGLYNIRIGNVRKYLMPYVTGEASTDQHLRYLAMCASFAEAIKDPRNTFEVYWPILSDTTLDTELRTGAYITLMSTKPSPEKLFDIYSLLKRDLNSDLYNLHYTYLKSLANVQDTDLQGDQTAEILNFMRMSYREKITGNYMADYQDPKYGFGAMNNMMLSSTNTSKSMFLELTTNMYNYHVMNYALWLKVDGLDEMEMELFTWNHDMDWREQLRQLSTKCEEQKHMRIEYVLLQNDKVIEFNYAECKDYAKMLREMTNHHLPKSSLSISYELIAQQIMPNDLGMRSLFDVFIPNLINCQLEEDMSGELVRKHWKFQRSSHARIGTAFYNPIADIWQGAERIQTNEIITDMNFNLSMLDSGLKLTIFNQNDDTRDKFSMRNYATTITFVYKDVNNVLQKSSKESEHFAKVSRGKQYRKDTLLFEYDCPHTGLHFSIDVFDTKRHVTHSTIMNFIRNAFHKHFKNYETMPLGYMLLALQNMAHKMILSPECGTFGLLIRATPSKLYPVDRAELLLQYNSERMTEERTLRLLDKINIGAQLTTKDKTNKMMNQWDVNIKVLMDLAHNLENYVLRYTETEPEAKLFEFCMKGKREMMNNKLMEYMNITKGYSTMDDRTCNDDIESMTIRINAEQSDEQMELMNHEMEYDECMSQHMHEPRLNEVNVDYRKNYECMEMKTSLRRTTITGEIENKMNDTNMHCLKMLKRWFYPHYSQEKMNNVMDDNKFKITLEFPLIGDEVNMEVMKHNMKHKFTEVPLHLLKHFGMGPSNYYYSDSFMKLKDMKMMECCLITDRHIFNNHEELSRIAGADDGWMRVVHSELKKNSIAVFVKQMDKLMALKMKLEENILEIMPNVDNTYKITLNGKPLTVTKNSYLEETLFDIGMLDDKDNTIILNMFNYPLYINYDGEHIEMHKLVTDSSLMGTCFMR